MINIEIKEDMNTKHGDAIGHSCRVEIKGNGDLLAAQVKYILDTFDRELPTPVWMAALDAFLSEHECGGDCEGCKYDCK